MARRVLNDADTTPRSIHRRRRWEPPGRSRSERLTCSRNARTYIDIRSMCLHPPSSTFSQRDTQRQGEMTARVLAQCPRACIPPSLSLPQHILRLSFRSPVLDISLDCDVGGMNDSVPKGPSRDFPVAKLCDYSLRPRSQRNVPVGRRQASRSCRSSFLPFFQSRGRVIDIRACGECRTATRAGWVSVNENGSLAGWARVEE